MPSAAAPAMSVASVSPTKSVRSGATPSALERALEDRRDRACAARPRTRRRRRRAARRRPARARSRWRSSGGSNAFETSPSLSPRSRSVSSSACVVDASWRAGRQAACSASRKRRELVVVDLDAELGEQRAAPAPGTRPPRSTPGSKKRGEVDVAEPLRHAARPARGPSAAKPAACPASSRSGSDAQCMSVSPQSKRTASSTAGYATRALTRRILWASSPSRPSTIARQLSRARRRDAACSCSRALRSSRSRG